jgi:RHS repeat-associated protein
VKRPCGKAQPKGVLESGFDYFGARYYASWLGRWCSPDPGFLIDGPNLYCYANLNPTTNLDRHGFEGEGGWRCGTRGATRRSQEKRKAALETKSGTNQTAARSRKI